MNQPHSESIGRKPTEIGIHEHYGVYGLTICSNLQMEELTSLSEDVTGVTYRVGTDISGLSESFGREKLITERSTNVGYPLEVRESKDWFHLRWPGAAEFHIKRSGDHIACIAFEKNASPSWVNSLFYGVVLSYVLHVRGQCNLHAGAVVTPRGALGILAEAGTGKSTLTAHLAASGLPFLTDDIVVPRRIGEAYEVPPGFRYVSLTAESIESLFGKGKVPDDMARGDVDVKDRVKVDGSWAQFEESPQKLGSLVVLSRGQGDYSLRQLGKQEAVMALVQHSVALPLLPKGLVSRHMAAAAELVKIVPVWRLEIPTGLDHIPETVEIIRRKFG